MRLNVGLQSEIKGSIGIGAPVAVIGRFRGADVLTSREAVKVGEIKTTILAYYMVSEVPDIFYRLWWGRPHLTSCLIRTSKLQLIRDGLNLRLIDN